MSDACPGCGSGIARRVGVQNPKSYGLNRYTCGKWADGTGPNDECLRRQRLLSRPTRDDVLAWIETRPFGSLDRRIGRAYLDDEIEFAQAKERIGELEAMRDRTADETDALRRAVNGVAPENPRHFGDLDLCVALNNHANLLALRPLVRAAMEKVRLDDLLRERYNDDHYNERDRQEFLCWEAVRALSPEVRKAMEVEG